MKYVIEVIGKDSFDIVYHEYGTFSEVICFLKNANYSKYNYNIYEVFKIVSEDNF